MSDLDVFALAARQIELDHAATAQMPALFDQKRARLAPSPHAFLRGSARLFYEILARRPDLAAGPGRHPGLRPGEPGFAQGPGDGWIVGDMHLENVGAYRDDEGDVVFGLNDFDDGTVGPIRLDVIRLAVSVLLAGRGFRATGAESLALVEHLVAAYLKALAGGAAPKAPDVIRDLVQKVKDRSNEDLLDARAPADAHGKRRFVRGDRYLDLPLDLSARAPALLEAYVAALGDRAPGKAAAWKVEDAAQRIAGNGSLGVLRVALLVRDHDGHERLVELKECRAPSPEALVTPPAGLWAHPADRVVKAARALLPALPRQLAAFTLDGRSFAGRRLFPQEDKLALDKMHAGASLDALVQLVGHLLGAAHARGLAALGAPAPAPWTAAEVGAVIDGAVAIAGLLEGVYLAWVRRVG